MNIYLFWILFSIIPSSPRGSSTSCRVDGKDPAFFFCHRSANLQNDVLVKLRSENRMRTNSAIPIVQQKGGALIYKYDCADLKELHNYAKEQ